MYTLSDDLGSRAGALAVCSAGGIDASNLTRVLAGQREFKPICIQTNTILLYLYAYLAIQICSVRTQIGTRLRACTRGRRSTSYGNLSE
jgi:hypothetical protein